VSPALAETDHGDAALSGHFVVATRAEWANVSCIENGQRSLACYRATPSSVRPVTEPMAATTGG
jgi:hypothetical protein